MFILIFLISLIPTEYIAKATVPIGNYLELIGGYLQASTTTTVSPAAFTFEAWINPDNVSGIQNIVSIGDKETSSLHYEVSINGGSLSLNYRYQPFSQKVITAGNLEKGIWSHIAVTISSSSTKLYINGTEIFSHLGASNLLPIGKNIVVGASYLEPKLSGNLFKGKIDEVRISDVARDIASLWAANAYQTLLPADSNTILLWHLDESRGQVVAGDSSGNNITAFLIGGDKKIHFFGVLPTPTSFLLPTLRWDRLVLPTISFPNRGANPTPTSIFPSVVLSPTPLYLPHLTRPVYPR